MARGVTIDAFPEKLRLALGRANLSRGAPGQAVGVDTSVVARWLSGALLPADHSLAVLRSALGRAIPDFNRAAWDLPLPGFAAQLGVQEPPSPAAVPALHEILSPMLRGTDMSHAAKAYAGLWASFVASPRGSGRLISYVGRLAPAPGAAALHAELGDGENYVSSGSLIAFGTKLYMVRQKVRRHDMLALSILAGVTTGRAVILEGLYVARDGGPEGALAAAPFLYFRIADALDDETFRAAQRLAGEITRTGWEALLPEAMLAQFRLSVPAAPAPSLLRQQVHDCWTMQDADLNDDRFAERRNALAIVRRIYPPALTRG